MSVSPEDLKKMDEVIEELEARGAPVDAVLAHLREEREGREEEARVLARTLCGCLRSRAREGGQDLFGARSRRVPSESRATSAL
jgi:vacuolar-type H+-ATPase subunit H